MIIDIINILISIFFPILLLIFIFLNTSFKDGMTKKYKNDERWQLIKLKSAEIVLKSLGILSIFVCSGYIYFTIIDSSNQIISLQNAFRIAFYAVTLRYPVEYFSLRYYDKAL